MMDGPRLGNVEECAILASSAKHGIFQPKASGDGCPHDAPPGVEGKPHPEQTEVPVVILVRCSGTDEEALDPYPMPQTPKDAVSF